MALSSDWSANYNMQNSRPLIARLPWAHWQWINKCIFLPPSGRSAVQNDNVTCQKQGHQHCQGHCLVSSTAANIPQANRYNIPNSKEGQTVPLNGIFWFNLHHGLVISRPVSMPQSGWEKTSPKAVRRNPSAKHSTTACHVEKYLLKLFCIAFEILFKYAEPATWDRLVPRSSTVS